MTRVARPPKLAVVATHPIQHFVPLYRRLAQETGRVSLHVFFASDMGLRSYFDEAMGTGISWKMDLTGGYPHTFLPSSPRSSRSILPADNPRIVAALDRLRPDAVLVYGYSTGVAVRAILWAARRGAPLLMISDSELLSKRSPLRRALKAPVVRWVARRASAILAVGDNNAAYWRFYGAPADRIFRSPFTIDQGAYESAREARATVRAAWRRARGVGEAETVVLSVGKLVPGKRPADLLDALDLMGPGVSGRIRLVFAGDGPLRPELEAAARERRLPVMFLGFVNVDELPAVYAAADILAHPSGQDAHPLVLSEAAAIGLPLVVSDRVGAVGATDIARPGENAHVVPAGDPAALARALSTLVLAPELRSRMAAESLRIFGEQDMDASVAGLLEALAKATSPQGAAQRGRPDSEQAQPA